MYFRSHHPFVDGEALKDELIKYDEMAVTKVLHALTFVCVHQDRQMMPPYLAEFFGACCDNWRTTPRPPWLLVRDREDSGEVEHSESEGARTAAGLGEPPEKKSIAGAAWGPCRPAILKDPTEASHETSNRSVECLGWASARPHAAQRLAASSKAPAVDFFLPGFRWV